MSTKRDDLIVGVGLMFVCATLAAVAVGTMWYVAIAG